MVPVIALLLAVNQAPAPMLPTSTGSELSQVCLGIEKALSSGDFASARTRCALLPKRAFAIEWDDSAVPASMKGNFVIARNRAIESWTRVVGLKPSFATDGDLLIRFSDHLSDDSIKLPLASEGTSGTHPRLTFTIGLKRGQPFEPIGPAEVYSEVGHAIGSYIGLADDPLLGSTMHREDHPHQKPNGPSIQDIFLATKILAITDQLRKDAEAEIKVEASAPSLVLSPASLDAGAVRQGTRIPIAFKVTNRGSSLLTYNLVPDCGCFSKVAPGGVKPGETVTLETTIDTTVWVGTQHKGLALYSNDPENPAISIPVAFTSLPAYRFYRPEDDTVIVPAGGCTIDVLLCLPKDSQMMPTHYEVSSPISAKVTMEHWSGVAPDPDMGESAAPRQGYRFHVKVPGELPLGQTSLSLSVLTDDPKFPVLQYDLYLQKGIVALPDNVFFGDVAADQKSSFRLSRHGKPFQILGVDSGSQFLTAALRPIKGQVEYEVDLTYKGRAPKGDFLSVVSVRTNDPKQPTIQVSVTGTVR
jgi:hypothetical protein